MLKNYLTIAWRNLLRSKWYSLINTLGLSIGIAVALLIGLWVWDELTFNNYHENHGRLAQVMTTQTFNGLGALLITLLTVSYQAIRAGMMNPVNSLRTE
jgi:hypothetical protein